MPEDTAFERVRAGIALCVQKGVDVLVLSLGPPSTEFDPGDHLQVATKAAYDHNIPVVVAAGNFGPGSCKPWPERLGSSQLAPSTPMRACFQIQARGRWAAKGQLW